MQAILSVYIASTLIPFLHNLQILVESFTLLNTDSTKVFREVSKMAMQKMHLDAHVAHVIYNNNSDPTAL